jgi:pyridinium-3,5-biscarboxylic acid mononucleotide sulfurtransferase
MLDGVLDRYPRLAIAVSGGVDSMTLAHAAHRRLPDVMMVHAVSPAVPAHATARVRVHAARAGWRLIVTGAGEFDDPRYRANPVDRCYFCKTNLYARIAAVTEMPIASGANLDDLSDYRPGLTAAAEHGVVHPFVLAGMKKDAVRGLARAWGLDDLAELPAQPCLSSRVETGLAIRAEDLDFIDRMERLLAPSVPAGADLRCRITHAGVVIEAAPGLDETAARKLCLAEGRVFLGLRPYRRGSAFLRPPP